MIKAREYWASYLIPLSLVGGYYLGSAAYWLPVLVAFAILPIADHLIGPDTANPSLEEEQALKEDFAFDLPLYTYAIVQFAAVIFGAFWFATRHLELYERIGLILSTGVVTGGLGITIAHELCHKTSKIGRATGFFLLALVSYTYFGIEHVSGHHRRVATPDDPTTSRLGESSYNFLFRSIVGSFLSVCEFEINRLAKRRLSPWSLRNRMIWCIVAPLAIATLLYFTAGPLATLFFLAQSLVAIILLELTNFVEHYGLLRKLRANGTYEKTTPAHSWNANQRLSNLFLFKLQRHADHHAHATRPYQILRHFEDSPQLPYGYPTMILMALVPPLWRRVMDPRVKRLEAQNA